jgi:hypothetical protein
MFLNISLQSIYENFKSMLQLFFQIMQHICKTVKGKLNDFT